MHKGIYLNRAGKTVFTHTTNESHDPIRCGADQFYPMTLKTWLRQWVRPIGATANRHVNTVGLGMSQVGSQSDGQTKPGKENG